MQLSSVERTASWRANGTSDTRASATANRLAGTDAESADPNITQTSNRELPVLPTQRSEAPHGQATGNQNPKSPEPVPQVAHESHKPTVNVATVSAPLTAAAKESANGQVPASGDSTNLSPAKEPPLSKLLLEFVQGLWRASADVVDSAPPGSANVQSGKAGRNAGSSQAPRTQISQDSTTYSIRRVN